MQEAKLWLEHHVVNGGKNRWEVKNLSSGLSATIEKSQTGGQPSPSDSYMLVVTGESLVGDIVIVRKDDASWHIFRIEQLHEGHLAIVPIDRPDGGSLTVIRLWSWDGGNLVSTADHKDLVFRFSLDSWKIADAIENNWHIRAYWQFLHLDAGFRVAPFPKEIDGTAGDYLHNLYQAIATREERDRLKDQVTKVGEVVKPVMGLHPQEPNTPVARLAMSRDPEVSGPGNDICRAFHAIADTIELPLPATDYIQPWQRPTDRRRRYPDPSIMRGDRLL